VAEGYVEHEGDVSTVSGLAEHIRDALLKYWVSIIQKADTIAELLKVECFNRWDSNRRCTIRIVD